METRRIGNSDINLSIIGLGTWAIGGNNWKYGWGAQDDQASINCIHAALDSGINWIDTAPAYGLGHAEEIVGKAIKQARVRPIIATKCGLFQDKKGDMFSRLKAQSIRKEVEGSLRRLQVPMIDIYQIHWPNPACDIEEGFATLLELKREGKIRQAAVCNFSLQQLEKITTYETPFSLQSAFSPVNREIERTIMPWCMQNSVGVLAYSPLQSGLLTGKVTKEWIAQLPHDDWRKEKAKYFREPLLSQALALAEQCKIKIKTLNANPVIATSLQWVLSRSGISSAIVGLRSEEQLHQVIAALQEKIDQDEISKIIINSRF